MCHSLLKLVSFLRSKPTVTTTCYLFSSPILHFHSTNSNNSSNSSPNPHTSYIIPTDLLHYSKTGFRKLEDALVMFDKMRKLKPLPPVMKFNQLLTALVKMKQYPVVVSLFMDMCYLRLHVDVFTFSIAINCCCYCHRLDYAFSLLAGVFKRGIVPNRFIYNIVIRGLFSHGKSAEADALFRKLVMFKEIEPDVVTFNTMINGLAKSGDTRMSLWWFSYMEDNGCQPDKVTYSTIIDLLCKCGLVDDALELHSKMMRKGIAPNIMTYTPIIQGLCRSDKWVEAAQLLKHMIDDMNISPDIHTFNIVVDAYSKAGKLEDAKRLIQIMDESGKYPDIITYNSLLEGYCLQGHIDGALDVLNTMACKKILPDYYTYSILLHGLCQVGRPLEALTFFYKVQGQGHELDDATYRTLLDGLFKNQYVDKALSFFHMMKCKCNGVVSNTKMYNIVICGCLRNKKYNEACGLIDKMVDCGISVDSLTTSLLQHLLLFESKDPTLITMHQKCMQSDNYKGKPGAQISVNIGDSDQAKDVDRDA